MTILTNNRKKILVNATAARSSGALSILHQFLQHIPEESLDDYFIFVDPHFEAEIMRPNMLYIPIKTVKWFDRVKWDMYGLQRWVDANHKKPDLIISFQNTTVKCKYDISQLVYYHQPLPLSQHHWNVFKRTELLYFLYKKFYSYFVSAYMNSKTHVVVQIPSIKKEFLKKFSIDESHVHVLRPDIVLPKYYSKNIEELDADIHFIYPATPIIYKNHIRIIEALHLINEVNPNLLSKIRVHFTFEAKKSRNLVRQINKYGLSNNIIFEGVLAYQALLSLYKSMRALLFPSFIESFGLPLIEAASAGIPIVVSDLPYSRDVIGEYEGVSFVGAYETEDWANAIMKLCEQRKVYSPFALSQESSWVSFFELVNQLK